MTPEPIDAAELFADARLTTVCRAAVDSFEIAAQLETAGLAGQAMMESFGHPDVFSLAESVYAGTPFSAPEPAAAPAPMHGGLRDLLRGVLYAVPTVLFSAALAGFGIHLIWWVIPVGLTSSWGLGQAIAMLGWTLRGRADARSDATLAAAAFGVAVLASGLLAIGAALVFGGTEAHVLAAVALALYVVMSGVLLLHDQEALLAAVLAPGAAGVLLSHVGGASLLSRQAGAWAVVLTLVLMTMAANRTALRRRWGRASFSRHEWRRALQYLAHGTCCGTLASIFIASSAATHARGDSLTIAVWPLLLSLGLMEWELRTFRGTAAAALSQAGDLQQFESLARRAFGRSFGAYVGLLLVLSVTAEFIGQRFHASMLPLFLVTEGILGLTFFLALLLEASGRIDLTIRAWAATFMALLTALLATFIVVGQISPQAAIVACLAAGAVGIAVLLVSGWRVLVSPLSY